LSLGDSYAAGFQPEPAGSTDGFAQQIAARSQAGSTPLTLYNFGCPGATSSALLQDTGCATAGSVTDGQDYAGRTQFDAALDTMRAHAGGIGLITVSVGGNDISACLYSADPLSCARTLIPTIQHNLGQILTGVRQVAGPDVPIVGITYPDVLVTDINSSDPSARARAEASIEVFRDVLNPALSAAYAAAGAGFVDITADSGAYRPADDVVMTTDGTTVPAAAAAICQYTHFCDSGDVHPTSAGYNFIADQILALLATKPLTERP
jgi:lysophospholipase L1-like esterase